MIAIHMLRRRARAGAGACVLAAAGGAPAFAQGFVPAQETQAGAFAGLRVHLSFGSATPEPLRAGLAFAPTVRTSTQDGRVRTRIAEGFEFGLRGREPAQFSIGGRSLRQLNAQDNGRRGRIPTGAWIAGGLVLVTVAVVVAAALVLESADHGD
jgi:hypothetical protein